VNVDITGETPTLTLSYDFEQWRKVCCCGHLYSPAACCSFLELERIVDARGRAGDTGN
jgi:hypothetical protein